jgi:hypothetical protein
MPLGPGRSDRKFCSDICRTAYNNKRRSEAVELSEPNEAESVMASIQKVYSILLDNRNRLQKMFGVHAYQLSLDEFNRYGINLKYFTSCYAHEEWARVFKMCFDYGYAIADGHVWLIHSPAEIHYN